MVSGGEADSYSVSQQLGSLRDLTARVTALLDPTVGRLHGLVFETRGRGIDALPCALFYQAYGCKVTVAADDTAVGECFAVERGSPRASQYIQTGAGYSTPAQTPSMRREGCGCCVHRWTGLGLHADRLVAVCESEDFQSSQYVWFEGGLTTGDRTLVQVLPGRAPRRRWQAILSDLRVFVSIEYFQEHPVRRRDRPEPMTMHLLGGRVSCHRNAYCSCAFLRT